MNSSPRIHSAAPTLLAAAALVTVPLSLAGAPLVAQSAWLGVAAPQPLSNPPQFSALEGGHFSAPAAAVPAGEERNVAEARRAPCPGRVSPNGMASFWPAS